MTALWRGWVMLGVAAGCVLAPVRASGQEGSPQVASEGLEAATRPASADDRAPAAARRPHVTTVQGEERRDDYFWLREKTSSDVIRYLEAENEYAERVLASTRDLQERLYEEMLGRIQQTDVSAPFPEGDYLYYHRTEEGKQYPIHARKRRGLQAARERRAEPESTPEERRLDQGSGPEEVTLDLNELARERSFIAVGVYAVSDDASLLAYSIDTTGFREYALYVKDLRTGEVLAEPFPAVSSAAWAADGRTLFYVTEDQAKRPYRLYRHELGKGAGELLYEEKDELFRIDVERTRSRDYLLLNVNSLTTSEIRVLEAADPAGEWRVAVPRKSGREVELDHRGERFYLRVNDVGRNFRLVSAPVSDPREDRWEEILPHRDDVMLEQVDLFADHLVAYERSGGLPGIRVADLRDGGEHRVSFPEPVYEVLPSTNREWETAVLRFSYESMTTPRSWYDYDMRTRERTLVKRTPVLGGYDPADYRTERLHATAKDGRRIPISIVYRTGFPRVGGGPLLLNGYGAYGYPYPVTFSSNRVSLLDRGVAVAIAHVRGGGELGKPWHDAGRMLNKMNTFTDFIAAAEFLIAERWTSSDRLVIEGGSAGGLLMGAVTNLRPDLFKAVVSHVPFVDVINTMLDPSLPLTVTEYEEWGNPNKQDEYAYLRAYSPYDNVAARDYPAMLVKTSLNDSQVMYWEPAKYVARLRTLKTDENPLLLVTNMGAGHGGASGRYDRLREIALDYAFMLDQMGLAK